MTIQDVTLIWDENMPKKGNFKCHYKQIVLSNVGYYNVTSSCRLSCILHLHCDQFWSVHLANKPGVILDWGGVGGGGSNRDTPQWHVTWVLVAAFRDLNFSNDSKRCWDIVKPSSFGHLLGVKMSQSEPCPQSKILFIYKELLETSTPHFYVGVPHTRGAGIPSTRIELAADL